MMKNIILGLLLFLAGNSFACTQWDCSAGATGTGNYVLQNTPTLTTPNIWNATATSLIMSGNTSPICSSTAPTLSGFGTSPSVVNNAGTCAFTINVGTGGAASTGTINLPAAAHGWVCSFTDISTQTKLTQQSGAGSTTTVPVTNYILSTGIAGAWTASDILVASCNGY